MFFFLTIFQGIIAAALVGVILMQRSEGGGLGIGGGGSPGGVMSARGAADFLSRATKWLAVTFVTVSIVLAALAVDSTTGDAVESSLDRNVTSEGADDPLFGPSASETAAEDSAAAEPAEPAPAEADTEAPTE